MLLLTDLSKQLLGLPTIGSPFTVASFGFVGLLAAVALSVSLSQSSHREQIDRGLFWAFGLALVAFAVLRPIGLARDDLAYVEILKALCPAGECSKGMPITRDWVWFWLVKSELPYLQGELCAALALSGLGVFVKLFVIDRLCHQRLLALLLLIPLSFIQYDLTQLRAGLASSWLMLGVYWLVRSHVLLGGAALLSNFAVHSQAVFSPGLLAYRLFARSRWILPVGVVALLGMIYFGAFPSSSVLNWLGLVSETAPYYTGMQAGAYVGVKVFPWGYFLILSYGVWFCSTVPEEQQKIADIVAAGLFLGTALAWFFAIIPTMQTRLFEFYAIPLVLLAGNVGRSKVKILMTCLLALVLYLRLELLHDWILG